MSRTFPRKIKLSRPSLPSLPRSQAEKISNFDKRTSAAIFKIDVLEFQFYCQKQAFTIVL